MNQTLQTPLIFNWGGDIYKTNNKEFEANQITLKKIIYQYDQIQDDFSLNSENNFENIDEGLQATRKILVSHLGAVDEGQIILTSGTMWGLRYVIDGILKRTGILITTNWEIPQLFSKLINVFNFDFKDHLVILDEADSQEEIVNKFVSKVSAVSSFGQSCALLVSHVTYNYGRILPIREIVNACKKINPNIFVMVDGAHAFGQIRINLTNLGCDFYAADFHKWLQGPNFAGFLYAKGEENLKILASEVDNIFAVAPKLRGENSYCSKSGPVTSPFIASQVRLQFFAQPRIQAVLDENNRRFANILKKRLHELQLPDVEILPYDEETSTGIVTLKFIDVKYYDRFRTFLFDNNVKFAIFTQQRIPVELQDRILTAPLIRFCASEIFNGKDDINSLCKLLRMYKG